MVEIRGPVVSEIFCEVVWGVRWGTGRRCSAGRKGLVSVRAELT